MQGHKVKAMLGRPSRAVLMARRSQGRLGNRHWVEVQEHPPGVALQMVARSGLLCRSHVIIRMGHALHTEVIPAALVEEHMMP